MKLLIIRFSSIGDIVLTSPAIRCLKQQIPGAEVHFLTKEKFKAVSIANPYIDQFHYFDKNIRQTIRDIRSEQFDCIIDLHKNWRTLRIYLETDITTKWLSYRKLSIQKFLLTRLGINSMPGIHISQRCLNALRPLGVKDDGKGLDYFIPKAEEIEITELPLSHQMGYIAVVIGGSYYTKKLPVYKLQELCRQINHPVVLLGGKEDVEEGASIAAVDPVKIYNACGKFSLNESADMVRKARFVISHDTGLQYIACAFQKPVLAVWGGTSPGLDVEPYYGSGSPQRHTNFIVPGLPCQPCSNFGTRTCPKKHFKCMHLQDIPAMTEKVKELL
jgi:ADP-heptose:LPS heptosyltransferase